MNANAYIYPNATLVILSDGTKSTYLVANNEAEALSESRKRGAQEFLTTTPITDKQFSLEKLRKHIPYIDLLDLRVSAPPTLGASALIAPREETPDEMTALIDEPLKLQEARQSPESEDLTAEEFIEELRNEPMLNETITSESAVLLDDAEADAATEKLDVQLSETEAPEVKNEKPASAKEARQAKKKGK